MSVGCGDGVLEDGAEELPRTTRLRVTGRWVRSRRLVNGRDGMENVGNGREIAMKNSEE